MGTKIFDKIMMTYQHDPGKTYTIPICCWYLKGGDQHILVDTGEWNPIQSADREAAIGGKIYTFEEGLARWDLKPEDIDIVWFIPIYTTITVKTISSVKTRCFTSMQKSWNTFTIHTEGGLSVAIETEKGKAVINGFWTINENFYSPKEVRTMEMDLIPPGTHINIYEAYEIMARVKSMADIMIPLQEPRFAAMDTV